MTVHFVTLLDQLRRRSLRMATLVEDVLAEACEAVDATDDALARRVVLRDEEVDAEEVEVEAEVIRLLALYQPVGSDLRLLCTVLKVNNDLERVADCAVNIAERAAHLKPATMPAGTVEIKEMAPAVRRMLHRAIRSYGDSDGKAALAILNEDEAVDALYGKIIQRVVQEATDDPQVLAAQFDVLSIAKNLERIADHATNIAEDVVFMATGKIIRHQPHREQI